MKAIGLVFLTLGCAASMSVQLARANLLRHPNKRLPASATNTVAIIREEAEHAAPADAGNARSGKPSDDQQNHRKVSGNKSSAQQLPAQAKQTTLMTSEQARTFRIRKIPRILISRVQTNLGAPTKRITPERNSQPRLHRIGRRVPSGPPCHRSAMCAIAELIPRSSVERRTQIPEIPGRSTARI